MRKQYFFRQSEHGLLAWDVDDLIRLSSVLPRQRVSIAEIREIDQPWSGDDETRSWRALLEHVRLIEEADLRYPIILSASGEVMDGMHRVAKAVLKGHTEIEAVRFLKDPEPNHVGREPHDLPY